MKPKPGGSGRINYGGRTQRNWGLGDNMSLRVVDPDSLNPVPAFQVNSDPPDTKNLRKKITDIFFFLFLIKNCDLCIPRPP